MAVVGEKEHILLNGVKVSTINVKEQSAQVEVRVKTSMPGNVEISPF